MTDKELRKLSRSELLEMLIAVTDENEKLKSRLEQAENRLQDRSIAIDQAGSIAEAALMLNGVFQAAEDAAQQYLENIRNLSSRQDAICRDIQAKAEQEAAEIVREAQQYSERAKAEADASKRRFIEMASELLKNQDALREMIRSQGEGMTQ
ncbi:MAG: hypothetical protein ACI3V0_10680 [Faecousia sp.]